MRLPGWSTWPKFARTIKPAACRRPECRLRAGWIVIAMFVPLVLVACRPDTPGASPSPPTQANLPAGSVSISGDDALAGVLSWTLPDVQVDDPIAARKAAQR